MRVDDPRDVSRHHTSAPGIAQERDVQVRLSPYDLERNDVEGALQCYAEAVAAGVSGVELGALVRVLLHLQDNCDVLLDRLLRTPTETRDGRTVKRRAAGRKPAVRTKKRR